MALGGLFFNGQMCIKHYFTEARALIILLTARSDFNLVPYVSNAYADPKTTILELA